MASQASMATQWLSRTIAIVILMIAPCYAGYLVDQRNGTKFWSIVGIFLGMLAMTSVFLVMAKQMIPPGQGEPLTDEEDENPDSDDAWNELTDKPEDLQSRQ